MLGSAQFILIQVNSFNPTFTSLSGQTLIRQAVRACFDSLTALTSRALHCDGGFKLSTPSLQQRCRCQEEHAHAIKSTACHQSHPAAPAAASRSNRLCSAELF
jgi:hypothetical protein